jgi:hypothetical protein
VCLCGPAFASDVRVHACFHMCVCMWLGWVGLEYLFIYILFYFIFLICSYCLFVYLLIICVHTVSQPLTQTV